ncbi:MAG: hypothetical protein ACJA2W_002594 [Planctomycetota bacterium]|jgi:hypothetical protein
MSSEPEPSLSEYTEVPLEDWVMTDGDRRELEIQIRMFREGSRAVREEVEWLEKHNFPIWIYHEGEVVDARTLPEEKRARNNEREFDLSKPAMQLRPKSWDKGNGGASDGTARLT